LFQIYVLLWNNSVRPSRQQGTILLECVVAGMAGPIWVICVCYASRRSLRRLKRSSAARPMPNMSHVEGSGVGTAMR